VHLTEKLSEEAK